MSVVRERILVGWLLGMILGGFMLCENYPIGTAVLGSASFIAFNIVARKWMREANK